MIEDDVEDYAQALRMCRGDHLDKVLPAAEAWIDVEEINDRSRYNMLRPDLDHGESEAIVLYIEKDMDLFLVDDGEARKAAESFGMKITGTGGLLLLAKQQGLISSVRSEIDKLEKDGEFRLSDSVRNILLQAAGE